MARLGRVALSAAAALAAAALMAYTVDSTRSSGPHDVPDTSAADVGPDALLSVSDQKDGDSFVASDGIEYRLGLVNAPEYNERCGPESTAFTRAFLAEGLRVDPYATDDYGRSVAEVFNADGASLNIALAQSGLGDDRYLASFAHENPGLAERLRDAFAIAATPSCADSAI